jgi:3-oxoacyl-(acyl-carrier-protein) synthase
VELIAAVKGIEQGILPPILNLEEPEKGNALDYVLQQAREAPVETVLCNAFGFGGVNCSLVVRRYTSER